MESMTIQVEGVEHMGEPKIWKTAVYIRISKDNGEDTLENQEDIVTKYLNTLRNVQVCAIKVDDGYSGLHCNRPAFQEMLRDIEQGTIIANKAVFTGTARECRN